MRKSSRAVIIENNKLITIFRRKIVNGEKKEYFVLPGGGVEANETFEQTVVREVMEELNLVVEVVSELGVTKDAEREEHIFECKILSGEIKLGGPELERNSEENFYQPTWIALGELSKFDISYKDLIEKAARHQVKAKVQQK